MEDVNVPSNQIIDELRTVRKRLTDLENAEARYRTLFDGIPDGIIIHDAKGRILDVNHVTCERLGHSTEALRGMHLREIVAPEFVDYIGKHIDRVAGNETVRFETEYMDRNGKRIRCEVIERLVEYHGSDAVQSIARDITERKCAEEKVIRHRQMLEATLTAVWEATAQNTERDICRAAVEAIRRHLGFDRAGMWMRHSSNIVRGTYGTNREGNTVDEYGQQFTVGSGMIEKKILDGEIKWHIRPKHPGGGTQYTTSIMKDVGWTAIVGLRTPESVVGFISVDNLMTNRPILDDQVACLALFGQDVANALAAAQIGVQLRRAQKMESVGTLAGGVAHNFNNILGIILGNAELLKMNLPASHAAGEFADKICLATERAAGLVRQLLSVYRKTSDEKAGVNIPSLIENVAQTMGVIVDNSIRIKWHVAPDVPDIAANYTEIEQVLMSICLNARDAMPDGGTLSIDADSDDLPPQFCDIFENVKPGKHVIVSIRDTGVGMDSDTLSRLFDPFFTTKEPGQGVGLGLAAAYGIVLSHGGCMDVESEPGKGAIFRIYLPAAREPAEHAP